MKKISFLILLGLLSIQSIKSQSSITGFIIYTIDLTTEFREGYKKNLQKKKKPSPTDRMILSSPSINAQLFFNTETSIYQFSQLQNETYKGQNFIKIMNGNENKFYSNSKTGESLEQDCKLLGECFLIKQPILKWEITQESKKTGRFTCYKALVTNVYKGRKSYIIAWFTPEIAVNFGPKEYNGLPGLILELKHKGLSFKATRIELNNMMALKMSRKIKRPKKGKVVTKKEFRILFSKATNNVFKK